MAVEGIYADKKTIVSGVVFSVGRGLVLTANHAIEAAPAIEVTLPNGTLVHGRAIARLHCHDLALLELNPKPAGVTALTFADSRDVRIDQPVRTLSYELTSSSTKLAGLTSTRGTVSAVGVREAFPPLPVTEPYIAHQSSLAASSSGSPLLDSAGKVVGINTLVGHPREPDKPGVEYRADVELRQEAPGPAEVHGRRAGRMGRRARPLPRGAAQAHRDRSRPRRAQ